MNPKNAAFPFLFGSFPAGKLGKKLGNVKRDEEKGLEGNLGILEWFGRDGS